jgi:hypothetical protein
MSTGRHEYISVDFSSISIPQIIEAIYIFGTGNSANYIFIIKMLILSGVRGMDATFKPTGTYLRRPDKIMLEL